ncbi:MAG TPA: Asp-tRNA(Asn)/Glu-tRNA(Gln) amidotransferase subunit GatC [Bryobacteraceae bacterium]|nr:Asp-tRNA(Asn)/Glu-tRNA(Gln) amidotransferase subunit GatC [Bryobacteraceae bacterium]
MKIAEKEVRYVAELANLSLSEAEVHKFQADLDEILGHVERLNEIDTTGVEPMAQVLYGSGDAASDLEMLRADQERPPLGTDVALANAPQSGGGYFKAPRVIER